MSLFSKSLTGGSSPTPVFTNTTVGSNGALRDTNVQLLKAGAAGRDQQGRRYDVEHELEQRHLRQLEPISGARPGPRRR